MVSKRKRKHGVGKTVRTYADHVYETDGAIELVAWARHHGLDIGRVRRAARATPSRLPAARKTLGDVWAIPANTPPSAYTAPSGRGFTSQRTDGRTRWLWYGTDVEYAAFVAWVADTGNGVIVNPRDLARARRAAKNGGDGGDGGDTATDETPVRVGADLMPDGAP